MGSIVCFLLLQMRHKQKMSLLNERVLQELQTWHKGSENYINVYVYYRCFVKYISINNAPGYDAFWSICFFLYFYIGKQEMFYRVPNMLANFQLENKSL